MFSNRSSISSSRFLNSTNVCLACLASLLLVPTTSVSAQGKLSRIRKSVRQHDSSDDRTDRNHKPKSTDDRADENNDRPARNQRGSSRDRDDRRSGGGGSGAFMSLFLSSPSVVERVHTIEPTPVFLNAPMPNPVYIVEDFSQPTVPAIEPVYESVVQSDFDETFRNQWCGRMTAWVGSDFEDISEGSFGLLLQCPGSLGLDVSATMLRESGTSFHDHLWIGDANLVFEGTTGDLRSRVGVGVNWLGDRFGGDAGFNLTAGFDWQLAQKLYLTGEADFGTVGDSDLLHGQISIGRQIQNAELMLGYNYLDIVGTTIGSAFTGLRFRF